MGKKETYCVVFRVVSSTGATSGGDWTTDIVEANDFDDARKQVQNKNGGALIQWGETSFYTGSVCDPSSGKQLDSNTGTVKSGLTVDTSFNSMLFTRMLEWIKSLLRLFS